MICANLTRRWRLAMGLISVCCLTSCAAPPAVITADRVVKPLPNGNYEVTPAWLRERYETERNLQRRWDECRDGAAPAGRRG